MPHLSTIVAVAVVLGFMILIHEFGHYAAAKLFKVRGEFLSHPRWQRFVIALAGPMMNILLAIALLTGVYMVHYERPVFADKPAVVGWVLPDSPAAKAGIKEGDRIIRIDGIEDPTWEQVEPRIALSPNQPLPVTILRAGQTFETTVTPKPMGTEPYGTLGCVPDQPRVI